MKGKNSVMEVFKMLIPNTQTKKQIESKKGRKLKMKRVSIIQINV